MKKVYKKLWFKITASLLALLFILFTAFYIYTLDYYKATPISTEVMAQTQNVVAVEKDNMLIFSPNNKANSTGFVFYPGGKVEYLAYVQLMRELANKGVTCVLVKMPFNLAVFNYDAANKALDSLTEIKKWYIGGHSLGGVMASVYASKNIDKIEGIVFLASYPTSDLSKSNLKMLSIYGSEDGVLNKDKLNESKDKASKEAKYIEVNGGNHAYFGAYGEQAGDGTPKITQAEQEKLTVDSIMEFIK